MAFTANVNLVKFNQIKFDFMNYYGRRLHLPEYEILKKFLVLYDKSLLIALTILESNANLNQKNVLYVEANKYNLVQINYVSSKNVSELLQ